MDFYEEFEFLVGNDGYSIASRLLLLLLLNRGVRRSTLCGKVVRVSYATISALQHVLPAVTKSLIAPVRVNRVVRAITPVSNYLASRKSTQGLDNLLVSQKYLVRSSIKSD